MDQWHIVVATRTARDGTLQVDRKPVIEGMANGAFTQTSFKTDLYIGGVDNFDEVAKKAQVSESFIGDIQRVRFLKDMDRFCNIKKKTVIEFGLEIDNAEICLISSKITLLSGNLLAFLGALALTSCKTDLYKVRLL